MKGTKRTKGLSKGSSNDDNNIVFECESDGIVFTSNSKYWIYILAKEQWEFIQTNMKKGYLYISAYTKKDIQKNDAILFYAKDTKGKPSGFVAIGQTGMIMEENKKNIRIFNDKNMNRFFTELGVISIFEYICKITELNDTIINANTSIKNSTRFSMTLLRGEGVFVEIVQKNLGLEIVKKIFDIASEKKNEIESTIDVNASEIDIESESENSADNDSDRLSSFKIKAKQIANTKMGKTAISCKTMNKSETPKSIKSNNTNSIKFTNKSSITSSTSHTPNKKLTIQINKQLDDTDSDINNDSEDYDTDSDINNDSEDYDSDDDDDDDDDDADDDDDDDDADDDDDDDSEISNENENDNNEIVTNIPVMLISCDQLRRTLKRQKQKDNKTKAVLDHYKYCNDCDITNNNSHELNLTLSRIDKSNIKFIENNCDNALEAYLNMTPYPKKINNEFIKIHHMTHNMFYNEDILLQYSTKIEPIIEIVEAKPKRKTTQKTLKSASTLSTSKIKVNNDIRVVSKSKLTKKVSTKK